MGLMLGDMKTLISVSIVYIYMRCTMDGSDEARETSLSINC